MCSIIGTRFVDSIMPLYELNSYRGKHSYSLSVFDINVGEIMTTIRGFGSLPQDTVDGVARAYSISSRYYFIVHSQAPTTESRDIANVHPAKVFDRDGMSLLWHNGIIKAPDVKILQDTLGSNSNWDTELLLQYITTGTGNLSNIDGSFSCLTYHKKNLYMFRNEISPMFIDFDMSISSTRFKNDCFATIPNHVYRLDLKNNTSILESVFTTKNSPYLLDME